MITEIGSLVIVDASEIPLRVKPSDEFYDEAKRSLLLARTLKIGQFVCVRIFSFDSRGRKIPTSIIPLKKIDKMTTWRNGPLRCISPFHTSDWIKVVISPHFTWKHLLDRIILYDFRFIGKVSIQFSRWESWIYCEKIKDAKSILSLFDKSVIERARE